MTRGSSRAEARPLSVDAGRLLEPDISAASRLCAPAEAGTAARQSRAGEKLRFDVPRKDPAFAIDDWDGGRLRVNRQFAQVLEANRLSTFEALINLTGGDVVRAIDSRSTVRVVLSCAGKDDAFFLKRHAPSRFVERLRPVMHLSRPILGARHEWEAILQFHAAGIPTMMPVAFGEFESRSLVMTRDLAADRTLLDWVEEAIGGQAVEKPGASGEPLSLKHRLIEEVAKIARRMHACGLHHQDFYLNHLLWCGNPADVDIRVIDLGRVRKHSRLSQRWIIKDLAQLNYSASRLSCHDRLRFLRIYLGRPFRYADRWLIRQILLKSWYIASHTAKNNL